MLGNLANRLRGIEFGRALAMTSLTTSLRYLIQIGHGNDCPEINNNTYL